MSTKLKAPKQNIPMEVFKVWKKNYRFGDQVELVKLTGASAPTINNAIKYGYVTIPLLVKAITEYFTARAESENEGAKQLKQLNQPQ